jgi:hypothetical protein
VASSDGFGNGVPIYTSTHAGDTWTATDSPSNQWQSVASSADGGKLVAASFYGLIYTSHSTPAPLLSIALSSYNATIAWLVPSSNFVLQQNSDLNTTNWTDVPTPPTLNYANLHYEVNVSPSPGSRLYRLKQE